MKRKLPVVWLMAGLLIVIAALVRLASLGQLPLAPDEAAAALEAANWVQRGSAFWQGQATNASPAYQSMTGVLMSFFGPTNFMARLIPALFGLSLVAVPFLLSSSMNWPVRLLTGLMLALGTASLTSSRSASGLTTAVFGVTLALTQLVPRRQASSQSNRLAFGLGAGIALAAGAEFWMGLFGLALAAGLSWLVPDAADESELETVAFSSFFHWKNALTAVVSAVLISSAFGAHIGGMAGLLEAPGTWLLGWAGSQGWGLITGLLVLVLYEPLLTLIGGFGLIQALRSGGWLQRAAAFWAAGAILAYLLYPSRQPGDLLWAAVPLALLAAFQIESFAEQINDLSTPVSTLLLALVLLTVLSFAYLQLESSVAGFGLASLDREAQLAFAITAVAFSVLLIFLFGVGWSWRETLLAVAIAFVIALAVFSVNASWVLNFQAEGQEARGLWRRQVSTAHLPLLQDTLADLSEWEVGRAGGMEIEVQGSVPAELAWALRDHKLASDLTSGQAPPVILAPESTQPELPAEYMGQAFALFESWGWQGILPPNILGWLLDRSAPVQYERWILFVRSDVAQLGQLPLPQGSE